ncbi:hypothetical protein BGZ54_003717, partial [Gamsiella multidivaricata]
MVQHQNVKQRKQHGGHDRTGPKDGAASPRHGAAAKTKKTSVLQGILLSILFFFLASYLVTDTWLWGYNGKYVNWRHWVPRKQIVVTQKELAQYDGADPTKPIYLAIKGEVFDV